MRTPVVYAVQYNLMGLHPVRTLKYDEESDGWYSRDGDTGYQALGRDFPRDITTENVVVRFFNKRPPAVALHTELATYRKFIIGHM
jgi:hypothetical protein